MTENTLRTLMRESAETIVTSPPPVAAITRAGRRRRQRTVALAAAAVIVLGGTAATAVPRLAGGGDSTGGPAAPTRDYGTDEVPVFLPESAFEVGIDRLRGSAELEGELRSTMDDRCLVVGDGTIPIFWPRGYEGLTDGSGGFALLDQDGKVVAEVGDTVILTGVVLGEAEHSDLGVCGPGATRPLQVEAPPEVID